MRTAWPAEASCTIQHNPAAIVVSPSARARPPSLSCRIIPRASTPSRASFLCTVRAPTPSRRSSVKRIRSPNAPPSAERAKGSFAQWDLETHSWSCRAR
jgi:hypothetical protein